MIMNFKKRRFGSAQQTTGADTTQPVYRLRIMLAVFALVITLTTCGSGGDTPADAGGGDQEQSQAIDTIDTAAPVTSASPSGGTYDSYNKTLAVTLTCGDGTGSGCAATYYSITYDGIPPTLWTPYTRPISTRTTTNCATLNFYSVDNAGNTEPFKTEVYFLYPETATLSRVSVSSGGWQADHNSYRPFISADGLKYVVFYSYASNFVAGDIKWNSDIFLRDIQSGTTFRVSEGFDGSQPDADSWSPSVSDNLRYVAFRSAATNLVPSDTNNAVDVFVYDIQTGTTERVNVATGVAQSSGDTTPFDNPDGSTMDGWYPPSMSADGRYVAFSSAASDLVSNDNNGVWDVFVHDRWTHATERVSVNANGEEDTRDSEGAAISADGRYVAFRTGGQLDVNRSTGWGSYPVTYPINIYVRDRENSTTSLISIATDGTLSNNNNYPPSITSDGRYVIFPSAAKTLAGWDAAAGDWVDTNGLDDIFVRDMQTGTTERVNVATGGAQGNGPSYWGAISDDGRYVTFSSSASNLTFGDTNGARDVFVRDRRTDITIHVVMAYDGTNPNARSLAPSISSDGQYIAFDSLAGNLIQDDTNNSWDIFRLVNPLYALP